MISRFVIALIGAAIVGWSSPAAAQEIRTAPPVVRDGEVVEVYVDERGKIYKELRYHGIIPEIRDHFGKEPRTRKGKAPEISWVGFQPKRFYSRVFIQVRGLSRFVLHKPDARHIVVKIEDARVPLRQTLRPVITAAFGTAVEKVQARRRRGGAEVTITLSKPVGYLYKQQGDYIYIDVER